MNIPKTENEGPKDDQFIGSATKWWLGTIVSFPVFFPIGAPLAAGNSHALLIIATSMVFGYLLSLLCTVVSVRKGEGWSGLAIVFSIGYTILLYRAWFG